MLRCLINGGGKAYPMPMQSYKKIPDGITPPGFLSYNVFEIFTYHYFLSTLTVVPSALRTMLMPFCISFSFLPLRS